jgi:hypothetical protein
MIRLSQMSLDRLYLTISLLDVNSLCKAYVPIAQAISKVSSAFIGIVAITYRAMAETENVSACANPGRQIVT